MNLRQPNRHPKEDEAWKKQEIAFSNYYTSRRAREQVEHDFASENKARNQTQQAEIERRKSIALIEERTKLSTAWIKMDRRLGEEDEELGLNGGGRIKTLNTTKLKEPGDYREANSNFSLRYENDTITPFGVYKFGGNFHHETNKPGILTSISAMKNFKENYNKAFDFAASQCGASRIEIDFESPGKRSLKRTLQLLEMARDRQLEVELGPNLRAYLLTVSNTAMVERIHATVRSVNQVAEERKKDPEFLNSMEASMLEQYGRELNSIDHKLIGPDQEEAKKQFRESINKKSGEDPLDDASLSEIEKQLQGFDERAKALANAERELSAQVNARTKDLERLAELEAGQAAGTGTPDEATEIEQLKQHFARLADGEPGAASKVDLREEMLKGLGLETDDLKTRETIMSETLEEIKGRVEETPEAARTEEQKARLQKVEGLEKTLTEQRKVLDGYLAADGRLAKLTDQNKDIAGKAKEFQNTPRLGL